MSAKVFKSVSAALDAISQMAIGQRIEVMGRPADVVSIPGAKTFKYVQECVVASTARPQDGRQYNRTATGFAAQEAE